VRGCCYCEEWEGGEEEGEEKEAKGGRGMVHFWGVLEREVEWWRLWMLLEVVSMKTP